MISSTDKLTLATLRANANVGYLTAEQGSNLASEGFILVNPAVVSSDNPHAFFCQLTQTGIDTVDEKETKFTPEPMSQFPISADVPVPVKIKRESSPKTSKYPFDLLEINQSFHVPVSDECPEPWKTVASNVGAANRRYEEPDPSGEIVATTRRKLVKDADGKPVKGADNKRVYEVISTQEPKKIQTRKFIGRRVDTDDPNGPGCRVFRIL